ncbi:MAG: RNA polymerase Rpb6 [Bacteroidetes bacterium GWF2_43_63]|nr:MAG: RNA polymerase Rpb6 [Bacteroidetes bacterium GWE2_42_42]OFY54024.1 MAG: RNA polymerase Rpb6 [Bacteroidetes bacterium GWF2_43_63]HCB63568.1 RNA polymerase Rpb6 [Bacteroidales bacterium]HCY23186.1 RNA polymerase Rpb6 [Bacteroidales bacterium]
MDYKKLKIETNAVTRNLFELENETGSIYESIMIISKRANQISMVIKEDLQHESEQFVSTMDNLEEVFENREQIELAKLYEALPKPTLIALHEFQQRKVYHRRGTQEN